MDRIAQKYNGIPREDSLIDLHNAYVDQDNRRYLKDDSVQLTSCWKQYCGVEQETTGIKRGVCASPLLLHRAAGSLRFEKVVIHDTSLSQPSTTVQQIWHRHLCTCMLICTYVCACVVL